jgi:hypothetical protein
MLGKCCLRALGRHRQLTLTRNTVMGSRLHAPGRPVMPQRGRLAEPGQCRRAALSLFTCARYGLQLPGASGPPAVHRDHRQHARFFATFTAYLLPAGLRRRTIRARRTMPMDAPVEDLDAPAEPLGPPGRLT